MMDNLLSKAIAIALLLAGFGVFYHYVFYLPALEKQKQQVLAEKQRKAEEERSIRNAEYEQCKLDARASYDANWANSCESWASSNERSLKLCLNDVQIITYYGQGYCFKSYGSIDHSPNCTLPGKKADDVENHYREALMLCEREAKLGM